MEKLLQAVCKKFIKQIDYNKIRLKKVDSGKADVYWGSEVGDDVYYEIYKIKYQVLTIGSIVLLFNKAKTIKYVSSIDINPAFRSRGIGGYILKHYFSGYYIMADNPRAGKLYERLGHSYAKMTTKELREFLSLNGMHGVWKLDSLTGKRKLILRRNRRLL